MGKHLDALPSLSEFRAPWETADGSEAEVDKSRLKRYLHGLQRDKAKAQDDLEASTEQVAAVTTERDEALRERDAASPDEANRKITSLTNERDTLKAERDGLVAENAAREIRAEVLGDFAAQNPKAAKYVTGTTKEELEASLKAVREDFGITEGDGEGGEDNPLRSAPQGKLRTGSQRGGDEPVGELDAEKIADQILGGSTYI